MGHSITGDLPQPKRGIVPRIEKFRFYLEYNAVLGGFGVGKRLALYGRHATRNDVYFDIEATSRRTIGSIWLRAS